MYHMYQYLSPDKVVATFGHDAIPEREESLTFESLIQVYHELGTRHPNFNIIKKFQILKKNGNVVPAYMQVINGLPYIAENPAP